ncbi:MAG: hypothetical protein KDI79_16825 [Anaerolineae bacterium]|nr:hypothetical protein [Anaerolineae bacterium]
MTTRSVLLVGSMPFDNEEACMRRALTALGPRLFSLPDGEVGEKTPVFPKGLRSSWVNLAFEKMTADTENWRVVREPVRGADGMPADYNSFQHLEALHPLEEMADRVEFGYDGYFRESYEIFKQLRQEYDLPGLKFQMGIPTGSALGFVFASPQEGMRYREMFNTVLAREANAALQAVGDDVLIQIEVPPELFAAYHFPDMIDLLALAPIYDLLSKIEAGAQIGIHLCLGDFHNQALNHVDSLTPMVDFSNRLVDGWPEQHRLQYIHYPLAEGAVPPTLDPAYYAPLEGVHLPEGGRFIAGFVHEKHTLADNQALLNTIETARGEPVDVACSCGLGRRTPAAAEQLLDYMAQLAVA